MYRLQGLGVQYAQNASVFTSNSGEQERRVRAGGGGMKFQNWVQGPYDKAWRAAFSLRALCLTYAF